MSNIHMERNEASFLMNTKRDPSIIKQMWHMIVKNKRIDIQNSGYVDNHVFDSWIRSVNHDLSISTFSEKRFLTKQKYIDHVSEYKNYLEFMKPFLHEFFESMGPSLYMLNLYSREGYHILRMGKDTALSYSDSIGIVEGLCFKEEINGTCGFSLADVLKKTVQICGPEHYKDILHDITGCYSPIFNEKGEYIGVISITNAKIKPNSNSVAMNFALSNALSFLFKNNDILKSYEKMTNKLRNYLNGLPDSLVVVNNLGVILDANQQFVELVEADNREDILGKNANLFMAGELKEIQDTVSHIFTTKGNYVEAIISTSIYYIDGERGYLILLKKTEQMRKNFHAYYNQDTNTRMVGQDGKYLRCLDIAYNCSKHNIPVLIEGESGTGKENVAKFIHDNSKMKDGPFVSVNCSAIPKDLFESIFFGYADGAFTNAKKGGSKGKLESANGGTLFLDEIGDMPIDLQAKLLRVVEDKYIEKIGMPGKIEVDFRLIVATNKVLKNEVEKNNFRKDLYYRINTILIQLPPLRERTTDIDLVINYYIDLFKNKYMKNRVAIGENLRIFFKNYNWPGNIREARNILEYMIVNNVSENVQLDLDDLPSYIKQHDKMAAKASHTNHTAHEIGIQNLRSTEIEIIKDAISKNSNKSEVARKLGISRDKLYRKIREINAEQGR